MKFHEMIQSQTPVLVDFTASWCGPCQALAPILKEVKAELGDSLHILKVDVDKNQQAAGAYQVSAVPTLIFFKAGKILWRQSGLISKADLIKTLHAHL